MCYCYQENTLCYWINKYFVNDTQKIIISCMILYFIGRLSTLGCQNKYETILKDENIFNDTKAFFASLGGVFFVLTSIIYAIIVVQIACSEKNSEKKIVLKDFLFLIVLNVDPNLLGIIFILNIDILSGLEYSSEILFFWIRLYAKSMKHILKEYIYSLLYL